MAFALFASSLRSPAYALRDGHEHILCSQIPSALVNLALGIGGATILFSNSGPWLWAGLIMAIVASFIRVWLNRAENKNPRILATGQTNFSGNALEPGKDKARYKALGIALFCSLFTAVLAVSWALSAISATHMYSVGGKIWNIFLAFSTGILSICKWNEVIILLKNRGNS